MPESADDVAAFEKKAQQRVLDAIDGRQVADFSSLPKPERRLSAAFLQRLISGSHGTHGALCVPLRIRGADITGPLLPPSAINQFGRAAVPFRECNFDSPVDLSGAQFLVLRFVDCVLPAFIGASLHVSADLDLSGSRISGVNDYESELSRVGTGAIHLNNARLGGKLDLSSTDRSRFSAAGTIRLDGARIDGSVSLAGAMLEPYTDDPDYESNTMLSVEELRDLLLELHEEKFDLHVHVIGDLAVKSVLDAVELARAEVGDDFYPRVSMGHLQNIHASDHARFAELDVSANFTPWWHGLDVPDPAAAGLGPERSNDTYRARAIFDTGGNVTFSSDDWRLEVLSPYLGMQVGHTRQYPREWLGEGEDPDAFRQPALEKLPLELMVKGSTMGGAYQLRMEDRIGSIETGKSADFVVLGENLFDVDPYTLHATKPNAVVMEGELIQGALP